MFVGIDIASERHMLAHLDNQGAPIGKPMLITEDRAGYDALLRALGYSTPGVKTRMPNLKLGLIPDEKPVKLTVELPAEVHRDLVAYGDVLARETGQVIEPAQMVATMLASFRAANRGFAGARSRSATTSRRLTSAPDPAN